MTVQSNDAILILDDDAAFRHLVAQMLQSRGYEVVEARTAKDASSIFLQTVPALAIVDYRLPESDGITWITQLREARHNFPVVFISGTWCDEGTFSWLRNILKVSLILRKPIVPELFLQQIENLLPPRSKQSVLAQNTVSEKLAKMQLILATALPTDDLHEQIEKLSQLVEESGADPVMLERLMEMCTKLQTQNKLNEAKQSYVLQLPNEWSGLAQNISLTKTNINNRTALEEGINTAHRLYGTAGSMGLDQVSIAAGKIENLLCRLDPTDTLSEVIWTELFRAHSEGEIAVREATSSFREPAKFCHTNILLVGNEPSYAPLLPELRVAGIGVTLCTSTISAEARAQRARYDAIILDLNTEPVEHILNSTAKMRLSQGKRPIPLGFVSRNQQHLDEAGLAYAGSSGVLWSPVEQEQLQRFITALGSKGNANKPRILTVDDDEVLTRFIGTILSGEGMVVEMLNQPIQILSVAEAFKPDLVLLDVIMPGLSGYDICRLLRATETWRELPIIFLTSKNDTEGRSAAFQAGGNDFLSKPVLAPELVARVTAQLDQVGYKEGRSQRDEVSGLITRKQFVTSAAELIEDAVQNRSKLALSLISIDDLNDLVALHSIYSIDNVINSLAELITTHFKAEAVRAKWGDGIFALLVPGESKSTLSGAIQKMLSEFALIKFYSTNTGNFIASFSAGLAAIPGDDRNVEVLINTANIRMQRVRQERTGASFK